MGLLVVPLFTLHRDALQQPSCANHLGNTNKYTDTTDHAGSIQCQGLLLSECLPKFLNSSTFNNSSGSWISFVPTFSPRISAPPEMCFNESLLSKKKNKSVIFLSKIIAYMQPVKCHITIQRPFRKTLYSVVSTFCEGIWFSSVFNNLVLGVWKRFGGVQVTSPVLRWKENNTLVRNTLSSLCCWEVWDMEKFK